MFSHELLSVVADQDHLFGILHQESIIFGHFDSSKAETLLFRVTGFQLVWEQANICSREQSLKCTVRGGASATDNQ